VTQIAIDGPASSGKSSVGIRVAASFGYGFLDTGLLYRAVTRAALDGGVLGAAGALLEVPATISAGDAEKLVQLAHLADVDLESGSATIVVDGRPFEASELEGGDVERAVAAIAAIPEVRAALRTVQRETAMRGGVVLAGRDIGTVVYPEAQHKFFLDASAETRALRRAIQRGFAEGSDEHQEALRSLIARDREDRGRLVAPLRAADDAHLIETDSLTLDSVVDQIVQRVRSSSHVA
jgi:cytidylate kinase